MNYDINIYKVYKEKGLLQGFIKNIKWEEDKVNYLLDSKYYICFYIKHNVSFYEAKNICKKLNMNFIRPYLISSIFLTHFNDKTEVWSGMFINKTRMFYDSNFIQPNNPFSSIHLSGYDVSNINVFE